MKTETLKSPIGEEFEVSSDGRMVWVNGPPYGFSRARFGPNGTEIDEVTRPGKVTMVTWKAWTGAVRALTGIAVSDDHRPTYLS